MQLSGQSERRAEYALSSALAFVAGFLDAASFVRGGGVFCAHVTGNLIVIASQLIHDQHVTRLTAATIPTFLVSVAVAGHTYRKFAHARNGLQTARRAVIYLEGAFIALACLLDALGHALGHSLGSGERSMFQNAVVLMLVIAMAAQTALQRMNPSLGSTTVMTGNLAQCFLELSSNLRLGTGARSSWCTDAARVVASFVVGCLCGAAMVTWFGFGVLVVPLWVLWRVGLREPEAHLSLTRTRARGDAHAG